MLAMQDGEIPAATSTSTFTAEAAGAAGTVPDGAGAAAGTAVTTPIMDPRHMHIPEGVGVPMEETV